MKDELNFSYNGGGVVYLLQSWAFHFNLEVGYFASKGEPKSHVQLNWRPERAVEINMEVHNYRVQLLCPPMPKWN